MAGEAGNEHTQTEDLDRAVSDAVSAGLAEIDRLDGIAKTAIADYRDLGATVAAAFGGASDAVLDFQARQQAFAQKFQTHLADQRKVLSTFNIAFFGRTGAGKSTLLSAFGERDGSAVSPGESDWTVETHSVSWRGCRLFDTPGINGWGRSKTRGELEATARQAVEIADVVLLCFDSQSQQASEFTKVAEWVRHYGKPTIAVLNNRNLRWRHPAKVPDQRARRNISEPVRQHASNIRGELANIGLHDTPVVAIHSRRALFARACTPYTGPGVPDFNHEREIYGVEYLARWSNFAVLECLISAGISAGGADLRLTSLREGIRALLQDESTELTRRAGQIEDRTTELDRAISLHLEILGYLEADDRTKYLQNEDNVDLLSLVEIARGAPYRSPVDGAFSRHVHNLVKPHLSKPRSDALGRFRKLEAEAFDKGQKVDGKRFADIVFAEAEVSEALQVVSSRASEYLERELSIATAGLRRNTFATEGDSATFDGTAGKTAENVEIFLRGSGLLGGLGAIAILATNPVGWVVGAAVAGIGLTTMVMGWLGQGAGESAERQRAKARKDAYRAGANAVFETFDRIEKSYIEVAREGAWQAAAPTVGQLTREFLALSSLRDNIIQSAQNLSSMAADLPESPSANIFADALPPQGGVGDAQALESASIAGTLLGEDWFEHSRGSDSVPGVQDQALAVLCSQRHAHDSAVLQQVLADAASSPPASYISQWHRRIENAAREDQAFFEVLAALSQMRSRPTMTVVGDFSAGKSSFIKRLLVELTGSSPESLAIRADPTTSEVQRYELAGFDLVDTPGFQSGRNQHDVRALAGVETSTLVIALFQVNLLIGDASQLEGIIKGTATTAGAWPRVLCIINRCDEIGVDPEHAVDEYFSRVDRKKTELHAALSSRGVDVDHTHIHGLASDPFGAVGPQWPATRAHYQSHRAWDGVAALAEALQSVTVDALSQAQRVADFDRSRSRLLVVCLQAQCEAETKQLEADKRESVIQTLEICLQDADYLSGSLERALGDKMARHAARAIEGVRGVPRGDSKKLAEEMSSWGGVEAQVDVGRFMASACEQINDWSAKYQSAIGREFQAAGITDGADFFSGQGEDDSGDDAIDGAARNAGRVVQGAHKVVGGIANRDAAYAIGKAFKVKFKPWGAVKAGQNVARAGIVLQVVAVGLDTASWINAELKRRDWQDAIDNAEAKVREESDAKIVELLRGEDGPLRFLDERGNAVHEALEESRRRQIVVHNEIEMLQLRAQIAEGLLAEAATSREVKNVD
ncbi:MAG: GTPase [Phycisphaeraceae bacterium]